MNPAKPHGVYRSGTWIFFEPRYGVAGHGATVCEALRALQFMMNAAGLFDSSAKS